MDGVFARSQGLDGLFRREPRRARRTSSPAERAPEPAAHTVERWWLRRSRPEKLALSAGALVACAGATALLLPELALAAAGGAVTAAAGWIVRKGLAG